MTDASGGLPGRNARAGTVSAPEEALRLAGAREAQRFRSRREASDALEGER